MSETHDVVTPTIDALEALPWTTCHRLQSGDARVRGGYMRGNETGTPDIIVSIYGRTLYLEAKSKDGKLKPAQRRFAERAIRNGCLYATIRSVSEALGIARKILAKGRP